MDNDAQEIVIDVPANAATINELLDQARHNDLVLRAADGTEFLLTKDDFEEEIQRTRQNKELMAFLDECRKEAATIPLEQVMRELGLE
jgi:glutamyl-tRNA reductase